MLRKVKLNLLSLLKASNFIELLKLINWVVRVISSFTHWLQFKVEWSSTNPEYFDHNLDVHYLWKKNRMSFPFERGVFSSFALVGNGATLDLCSGDGFNSYYFYSINSKTVTGIDFDRNAIKWAKRNFKARNLEFVEGDIRSDLPSGPYDNIIWDAAIEHFTEEEIKELMKSIKDNLKPAGILSGYTILEQDNGEKHLHQHEYEFHDKDDLARFFTPWFRNVQVFTTTYSSRTNLYFYASDEKLPFEKENNLIIHS